jgi:uncharacterized FAD-dependent dehydrogenase
MVISMRETIEALGGEYRFKTPADFDIKDGALAGLHLVSTEDGAESYLPATHCILAPGHSSRDTFEVLHKRNVFMEAKPFAIGVRIEHPQSWVDKARYGACAGHPVLGAAAYAISHQASNGRAVPSFCMCPGGRVVAATSEEGRVVTNGMSQYSRAEFNANSGLVVTVDPGKDYPADPLAGIEFQRKWESLAFTAGGGDYCAPGQKVGDLLAGRASSGEFGAVKPSYQPGVKLTDLSACLPDYVIDAIREALPVFGRQIPMYDHPDVIMTGVETRTSSRLRITRARISVSQHARALSGG